MNRRKFALSWGRKVFFGLSLPLSLLLALIYLRSFIFPEGQLDWAYFITTLIGHYGAMTALVYFLLYCPIILMSPSYYTSRIWSLILILSLNLLILLDGLSFATYQLHLDSYLLGLLNEMGFNQLLGSSLGLSAIVLAAVIFSIVFWIRGEFIWRSMQTRFSNPVKNWYVLFIVACLITSKVIFHFGGIHPKLASLFPFNHHLPQKNVSRKKDNRRFFYPSEALVCSAKQNPSVILIAVQEWGTDQFREDLMPNVFHMRRHARMFNQHYNVAQSAAGGLFALNYSIPASYLTASEGRPSAFRTELSKRKYEVVDFGGAENGLAPAESDQKALESFRQWISDSSTMGEAPFFVSLTLRQHSSEIDKVISELVFSLQRNDLLGGTHVLLTGGYSGKESSLIPFLYFTPERKRSEVNYPTSHYDVLPSLMQKLWNCKNVFEVASTGVPLERADREWLLVSGDDGFSILDFLKGGEIKIQAGKVSDSVTGKPRHELIFQALRLMNGYKKSE